MQTLPRVKAESLMQSDFLWASRISLHQFDLTVEAMAD